MSTSVVVTGLGATTPLGGDVPTTWAAAMAGTSTAAPWRGPWVAEWQGERALPVGFGCQLAVPADEVLEKVHTKRLDLSGQYALIAAREAWAHAGLRGEASVPADRLGVVVGSGIGGIGTTLSAYDTLRTRGARRVHPLTVPMLMPNGPAAAISIELGARAGTHTPVSACATGAEAIAAGADMIRSGRADVVVAGGTEAAIVPLCIAGFAAMQALSTREDDPSRASRPYDSARDGFVLGEGGAVVVLESAEHAAARGATVHAELLGAGVSSDAHHIAAPEPDGSGAAAAMSAALHQAGVSPAEVRHINAHATSTPIGDVAEAAAIRLALGPAADGVAVSATKSMTGHLLGAAGALEAVFTILALRDRTAPPTVNLDDLDPAVDLDVVGKDPRPLGGGDGRILGINNSFGFGGHNVALLFGSR
ncbi:MAG: beta-ketoacyl-[acyl-carrier-protein] synthase family protein [Kineosporiaceae bacterium]